MTGQTDPAAAALPPLRLLFRAPVIAEFLLGISPLAGIAWWQWDVYLVMMLHLLAIGVSSLWLVLRTLVLRESELRYFMPLPKGKPLPRGLRFVYAGFALFVLGLTVTLFTGMITTEFAPQWSKLMHGPSDFWRIVVIEHRLWIPLAAVCAWEAVSFVADVVLPRLPLANRFQAPRRHVANEWAVLPTELQAYLCARALVTLRMLATVIGVGLGMFLAQLLGLIAIVVMLVLFKTAASLLVVIGHLWDAEPDAPGKSVPSKVAANKPAPGKRKRA